MYSIKEIYGDDTGPAPTGASSVEKRKPIRKKPTGGG